MISWCGCFGFGDTVGASPSLTVSPETAPSRASRCKTFISPGHDEYWDLRQYESAMAAIQNGTSAQFLTGNAVFMMTPFQPSTDGRPNRIITRVGRYGGMTEKEKEAYGHMMGPFDIEGPNENLLMGARSIVPSPTRIEGDVGKVVAGVKHMCIFRQAGFGPQFRQEQIEAV